MPKPLPPTPPPTPFDVARWTRAARAGSQAGYAALYARFAPLVHGILLGRFRPAIADELTQECFQQAFARLGQLREDHKFGAWIAVAARRLQPAPGEHRDTGDEVAAVASVAAGPDERTEAANLLAAIVDLPEAYRETLLLRLVEGQSGAEIAALTGLTPASVRVNLHRGMALLRQRLGISAAAKEAPHD